MVDKGYRLMMLKWKKPRKVIEDEKGAGALGRPSPNNRSPHQRTARVRDFAGRGYCYLAKGCSNCH